MKIIKITESTTYEQLMKIIISGCKFKYYSYDHKKALKEYETTEEYSALVDDGFKSIFGDRKIDCYDIPNYLKEKYKTERVGKLRSIDFAPNGKAWKFRIGAKYAKVYYISDFGKTVFPIKIED